jgi:MFS family permease
VASPTVPAGASHAPAGRYYGWWIVHTLGLTELISWGIVYYGFGALLTPMQQDLGWTQPQLTGAFALAMLLGGLTAVPVGRMLDRAGARLLMTVGSIAATLLVLAWSQVTSLIAFYLIWAGLGATMALILYEPAFAVVTTWFTRDRSRALTVLTIWGGLASVVCIPLTTALTSAFGWRTALVILAALLGVVTIPLHALVLRRRPQDHGWHPDGIAPALTVDPSAAALPATFPAPSAAISVRGALRGATFWWLALAFALSTGVTITINVHLLSYLTRTGHGAALAATAAGLIGASQIPSRILIAVLGRRVSHRTVVLVLSACQALALVLLLLVPVSGGVLVFAALFGAGSGALTPTRAALIADIYGSTHYGSISGLIAFLSTTARALAPFGASVLVTATGTYTPLLWGLVLMTIISAAATVVGWAVRPQSIVQETHL